MNPPLIAMLGTQWDLEAPVVGLAWSGDGRALGYALGDGRLAMVDTQWRGGPQVEARDGGGVTLRPAERPAPVPEAVRCHGGSCHGVAAHAAGGFVTGGDDGRVVRSWQARRQEAIATGREAWIDAVACSTTGDVAYAGGRQVARCRADGTTEALDLPASAAGLAFAPDGQALAVAHSGGVTLWGADGTTRLLAWSGYHRSVAWSPDGRYVVSGMQENALHGWRVADGGDIEMGGYMGQPLSLSFSAGGRTLVTSGALRPVCWDFLRPGSAPGECGIASKAPVGCVACHPRDGVIAVGHHSGALSLCRPGSDDFLLVKGTGGGAVSALAWSPSGTQLAFGTEGGAFGWIGLPELIFQRRAQPAANPRTLDQEVTQ
jgi:WD40 repeat protein